MSVDSGDKWSVVDFQDLDLRNIKKDRWGRKTKDIDNLDLENQEKLKGHRYKQDTSERKLLAHWVIAIVSSWLGMVLFILICNKILCINLSDTVLCALLGTTTINILGLAYIVLKGLFYNGNENRDDQA